MFGSKGKTKTRNILASVFAGAFFALGWWLIIDASIQYPSATDFKKIYHLIGVIGTLAFFLTNSISNSQVQGDASSGNRCLSQFNARLFLLFSFILVFGSLIASAWVLFGCYLPSKTANLYPGMAIFGQNLAIAISTFIFKFARKDEFIF